MGLQLRDLRGRRSSVAVALALLAQFATGCVPAREAAVIVAAPTPEAIAPETVNAAGCIDGTKSVPRPARRLVLAALTTTVEDWFTDVSVDKGSPPQAGLHLALRKVVADSSLAADAEVARVTLDGVPGVPPPPALDAANIAARAEQRKLAEATASALAEARQEAATAAADLEQVDWTGASSEIYGCLFAASLSVPAGGVRRVFLVSDLAQTDPPQRALHRFEDAAVLVIDACTKARVCAKRERALRADASWSSALARSRSYAPRTRVSPSLPSCIRGSFDDDAVCRFGIPRGGRGRGHVGRRRMAGLPKAGDVDLQAAREMGIDAWLAARFAAFRAEMAGLRGRLDQRAWPTRTHGLGTPATSSGCARHTRTCWRGLLSPSPSPRSAWSALRSTWASTSP